MKYLKRILKAGTSVLLASALFLGCLSPITAMAREGGSDSGDVWQITDPAAAPAAENSETDAATETPAVDAAVTEEMPLEQAAADAAESGAVLGAAGQEELSYHELYIKKHQEFMETGDYADMMAVPGGIAYAMSAQFQADGLEAVNSIWDNFASVASFIGSGSVDDNLEAQVQVSNEYEVLVAYIMQTSASQDAFAAAYSDVYADAASQILLSVKDILSTSQDIVSKLNEADLGKVEELVTYIDEVYTLIQLKKGVASEDLDTLYADALKTVKEKINATPLASDKDFLTDLGNALGIAVDVISLVSDSFTKLADVYVRTETMMRASDTWIGVWQSVADHAALAGGSHNIKLANAINTILDQIIQGREDMAALLIEEAQDTAAVEVTKFGLKQASSVFNGITKNNFIIQGIRKGLIAGITTANLVTNIDDITYYSHLLVGAGELANAAFAALSDAALTFSLDPTMSYAAAFDEAFHIYKETQLATIDYAIDYNQAIATAGLGQFFLYTTDDEIAASALLLGYKADWSQLECHEFDYDVINNGGLAVGYLGKYYYWRLNPGALSETGLLGYFDRDYSVQNDLICRSADGSEEVILSSPVYDGRIFISGEYIYFESNFNETTRCALDGSGASTWTKLRPVGINTTANCLIAEDTSVYELVSIDSQGQRRTIVSSNNGSFLACVGIHVLYTSTTDQTVTFYAQALDTGFTFPIGSSTMSENYGYASAGVPVFTDTGIYVTVGSYAGTGNFYYGTNLVKIDFESGVAYDILTFPNDFGSGIGFVKIYVQPMENEEGAQWNRIYLSIDSDYSNVGNGDSYTDANVYYYDERDGVCVAAPEGFILSNIGDGVTAGNMLQTLLDDSGEYTTILSTEELNTLGYDGFYFENEGRTIMVSDTDVVENKVFFTILDMEVYPEASLGWRTGYKMNSRVTYMKDLETGEITELYRLP